MYLFSAFDGHIWSFQALARTPIVAIHILSTCLFVHGGTFFSDNYMLHITVFKGVHIW